MQPRDGDAQGATTAGGVRRILGEPLFHFFLLGALLFALYSGLHGARDTDPQRIHVDAARIALLRQGFLRTWQRPPTQAELDALVDEFVREEIFYREALAMGLDRDDLIVRRRMRQKLEFLSEDVAPLAEPDDAALARHLEENAADYRIEPKIALRQVFVDRDRRGDRAMAHALALRAQLEAGADPEASGDASLLPAALDPLPLGGVARVFGDGFAAAVRALPTGRWSEPVESAYGLHLIFIESQEAARMPALDEVREAVRNDWLAARRAESNAAFYEALRQRYEVSVDPGDEAAGAAGTP